MAQIEGTNQVTCNTYSGAWTQMAHYERTSRKVQFRGLNFSMLLILVLVMPVWIAEPPAHFAHCNRKEDVRQYLENRA